jgi:hypothetical protein
VAVGSATVAVAGTGVVPGAVVAGVSPQPVASRMNTRDRMAVRKTLRYMVDLLIQFSLLGLFLRNAGQVYHATAS